MTDPAAIARGKRLQELYMGTRDPASEFNRVRATNDRWSDLNELADEVVWGRIYSRPGLSLRDRSLCVIVMHISRYNYEHARIHIGAAKRIGLGREELGEAIIQLLMYIGLPAVRVGLAIVDDVFDDETIQPDPEAIAVASGSQDVELPE